MPNPRTVSKLPCGTVDAQPRVGGDPRVVTYPYPPDHHSMGAYNYPITKPRTGFCGGPMLPFAGAADSQ